MAINYRKIKSQVKPYKAFFEPKNRREREGFLFQPTTEQHDLIPMLTYGRAAKRRLIETVAQFANTDSEWAKHFKFNHQPRKS